MRIIVTAGPTREYIDPVRFITNASSGRMGYAVAEAAVAAGHDVTLLTGLVPLTPPVGCQVVSFVTVLSLKAALEERFDQCDALVMAAAVGDFRPEAPQLQKMHRAQGPILLRLVPTEDIVGGLAEKKQRGQVVVAFAVEDGTPKQIQARARIKLLTKNADFVVANTLEAFAEAEIRACIISSTAVVLPWASRTKEQLAEKIVSLLAKGC